MSVIPSRIVRWGVRWRSSNMLDGERTYLIGHMGIPALFRTRREARAYAHDHYGYIKERPDLRAEPHGWRMPEPIRVVVEPLPPVPDPHQVRHGG